MTTIAYDGNGTIAGDLQSSFGDTRLPSATKKIIPVTHREERYLVGSSGSEPVAMELFRHFVLPRRLAGVPPPFQNKVEEKATVIAVHLSHKDGPRVYLLTICGSFTDITGSAWAIGSGREFSMGAMAHGATAEQAVHVASIYDLYTGPTTQVEQIARWRTAPVINFTKLVEHGAE